MEPSVWVKKIKFSDGSILEFSPNDIIVIVGPNNSGKSVTLKFIRDNCANAVLSNPVVHQVDFVREGTIGDVLDWLSRTASVATDQAGNTVFHSLGTSVYELNLKAYWGNRSIGLNDGTGLFCRLLSADQRLSAANPPASIAVTREPPTHPIHRLYMDEHIEQRISQHFRKAFGLDIVVHRAAGNQVPIHVGERPVPKGGQDRVSREYLEELERLPQAHTQGDGIRSFLGTVLFAMVGQESLLLIDEPEAFLHPPQARQLGRMIVTDSRTTQQIFVATHSGDFLRGVLDSDSGRVRIIRIRRSGPVNVARELKNSELVSLWSDPLLRYSNILDGLFHERVVLCESDADCRFYAAMMEAMFETSDQTQRRPDVMFTHCGGKARLPLVVRSLRDLDVPMSVVADFDLLSDEQPLRSVFEAAGGEWSSIEPDWREVKNAIDSKKPELSSEEVMSGIRRVLADVSSQFFPSSAKKEIQSILKRSSPWSSAKLTGAQYVPNGQPTNSYRKLTSRLESAGIFVVPVGEIEGFVKDAGGHGPSWVAEALKRDLGHDPELRTAREFVSKLLD